MVDPVFKVAASPDGAHLAVLHDGRLSLYALDGGRRIASEAVVGTDLVFCGPHLLVHASDAAGSVLTLLALPSLSPVSVVELMATTRVQASSGVYALLDQGDQALMAQGSSATIAVAPLRPPAAFTRAVGLEANQFVTFSGRGAEVWDAASRRPLARLGLTLPIDAGAIGLTNRGTALWIATTQPALHVARISDGRISTLRLDAQPRDIRSHPALAWVVADVGDRTLAINVAVKELEVAPTTMGPIVAIVPRRERETGAMLIALDGERLHLRAVGADADGDRATVRVAPVVDDVIAPAPVATPRLESPAPDAVPTTRPMTVSERLAQRSTARVDVPMPVPKAQMLTPMPASVLESFASTASLSPSPSPSPGRGGGTPGPTGLESREGEVGSPPPPPSPSPSPRRAPLAPRPTEPAAWRADLLTWARASTATVATPMPALDGSPLLALGQRAGLTAAATHILGALYAAWLDGRAETGTPIARLAELATPAGDDAWTEALGTGRLDELGLVRRSLGRVRVSAATGDFLDGRGPGAIERIGSGAPSALPDGVFRVEADHGESARDCAHRLIRARGLELVATLGTLALCEPDGPARTARATIDHARLEAWLRGLALATPFELGDATTRPGETLLWIVPSGAPDRPGDPPRWRP